MRKKMLCYCLGLILTGIASSTWAWAQPPAQSSAQPGSGRGGGFQAQFQEIKRTQMGPVLGVNAQTVDQLLQVEQRYKPLRQQLIKESIGEYRRLQQVMSQPSPSEQEVKGILSNIKRKQKEMQDLQARQGAEEEALLTPVQQARYLIYQKKLLQEARSVKGGSQGETMPRMPQGPREIPVSRPAMPGR